MSAVAAAERVKEVKTLAQLQAEIEADMMVGAKNYSRYDKSDPFSFDRAVAHIKNGICSAGLDRTSDKFYKAEPYMATRSYQVDGQAHNFNVVEYKNLARP